MEDPREVVTVILPAYNCQSTIEKAIKSILNQSYKNFKLLVVNDGSTDNTLEIITKISSTDKRISFYSQSNKGLITTLNEALETVDTKYFARQDADDTSHPERLEKQIKYLEKNPNITLVGSTFEIDYFGKQKKVFPSQTIPSFVKYHLLTGNNLAHGSVMGITTNFRKEGFYSNEPYAKHIEDYEAWTRLSLNYNISNLEEVLYFYSSHPDNISNKYSKIQKENKKIIVENLWRNKNFIYNTCNDFVNSLTLNQTKSLTPEIKNEIQKRIFVTIKYSIKNKHYKALLLHLEMFLCKPFVTLDLIKYLFLKVKNRITTK